MKNYKKKISFLIPTNRKFEENINNTIQSIRDNVGNYSYEICVFSEEMISGPDIKWFQEIGKKGPIYGFNHMSKYCEGEYIVCLTDDHVLLNNISPTIKLLDSMDQEYVVTSLSTVNFEFVGNPIRGEVLGDQIIDFECNKYPLVRFPVLNKDTLKKLGDVIFNESFFYHAGDIWLGYYLGSKGFNFINSPTIIEPKNPKKDATYEVSDCNICRKLFETLREKNIEYNYSL